MSWWVICLEKQSHGLWRGESYLLLGGIGRGECMLWMGLKAMTVGMIVEEV